jgi:hypothetical protein
MIWSRSTSSCATVASRLRAQGRQTREGDPSRRPSMTSGPNPLTRQQAELLPFFDRQLADDTAVLGVIDQFLGRLPRGEHLQRAVQAGGGDTPAIR